MATAEKSHKVLILEDERNLLSAIKDAFAKRAFTTIVAETVEEGLHQLENNEHIDVIWLDHYLLGSKNGVDFVVQVKAHEQWRNIPIFVVSNSSATANISSYIQLGVANYYTKSDYDIEQIMDDIEFALDQKPPKAALV